MSVKVMGMVFDRYPVGGSECLLALAIADHAHHDGTNVFPTVGELARKTKQSVRSTQMQLRRMEEDRWLILVDHGDGGRGRSREYRVNPDWIAGQELPAHVERAARFEDKPAPEKGAEVAPFSSPGDATEPVDNSGNKGCSSFTLLPERVQNGAGKGAAGCTRIRNPKEPSVNPSPKSPPSREGTGPERAEPQDLKSWIAQCKAAGQRLVPADDEIRQTAARIGLSNDLVDLCLREFVRRWSKSGKRRADWRAFFRECVTRNAYRLWWVAADGRYELSSHGRNALALHGAAPVEEMGEGAALVWSDDVRIVQQIGEALGVGRWDRDAFDRGRGEAWPVYRARVRQAFEAQQLEERAA